MTDTQTNTTETNDVLINLTSDIVSAHVSNNSVSISDLPALITNIFTTLASLTAVEAPVAAEVMPEPAVSIRSSVKNDHIVCLEDGKKLKMLKRHLRTTYDMTPDDYRKRWSLPADYPMVAPAYAEKRRELAKAIGLGRKPGAKRGRPSKASIAAAAAMAAE